jgi:SAM-dependent methyltransferase
MGLKSTAPRMLGEKLSQPKYRLWGPPLKTIAEMQDNKPPIDTTAAQAYEQHVVPGLFMHWARRAVELAAPRPGEHVLDAACGTGIGARLAAKRIGEDGTIVGLDVDAGVVEMARTVAQRERIAIEWHCASALEMPFDKGLFDLCLCLHGLQFFPDRVAGLAEIRRVLKPSGRLVAMVWGPLEHNKGHHAVVQALERQKVDASAAKRAFSLANAEDLRDAASRAGFTHIELRTEDAQTDFSSIASFFDGMTTGSPSTRHALALIPAEGRAAFRDEVSAALERYVADGKLAYPTRAHILLARP